MIVRWPGHIEPGIVSDHVWPFWDFLPTAADLAGVDAPANTDGISVLPTLLGQPQQTHEHLYWIHYPERMDDPVLQQAVRMGDWKAIRQGFDGPTELYSLQGDVCEEEDISEQQPEIVREVEQIMQTVCVEPKRCLHLPIMFDAPEGRRFPGVVEQGVHGERR